MKSTRMCVVLVFAVVFGFQQSNAINAEGTTGQTCYPINFQNAGATPTMSVFTDLKVRFVDRVSHNVSGLTVTIVGILDGTQNNSGPFAGKRRFDLIIATTNATPGEAEIRLVDAPASTAGYYTFKIFIIAPPTVTGSLSPTPVDPFNNITVTLIGTGLQHAKNPAAGTIIKNDPLIPFITAGGDANIQSVRVLSSSNTSLQAQILFTAPIQDATVELTLQSDDVCVPLGVRPKLVKNFIPFKTRVRVRSQMERGRI